MDLQVSTIGVALEQLRAVSLAQDLHEALSPEALQALRQNIDCAVERLAWDRSGSGLSDETTTAVCAVAQQTILAMGTDGLTPPLAVVLRQGLVLLATLMAPCNAASTQPRERAADQVLHALDAVGKNLDSLVLQLFIALRRAEGVLKYQRPSETMTAEVLYLRELQGIGIWTLALLGRAVGLQRLTSRVIWEWGGSSFCIFVIARWLLASGTRVENSGQGNLAHGSLNAVRDASLLPEELWELQQAVLGAVFDLASPSCVFDGRIDASIDVAISDRNRSLGLHRVNLALDAAMCDITEVLIENIARPQRPGGRAWPLVVVAFLSALVKPPIEPLPENLSGAAFARALTPFSGRLWELLAQALLDNQNGPPPRGVALRSFLRDSAILAFNVTPPIGGAVAWEYLQRCVGGNAHPEIAAEIQADPRALSALLAFAANSGIGPETGAEVLANCLARATPEVRAEAQTRFGTWPGPVNSDGRTLWITHLASAAMVTAALVSAAAQAAAAEDDEWSYWPAGEAHSPEPPEPAKPAAPVHVSLRDLVANVPAEYCCAIDGKFLIDPVRSPYGHVFERSSLIQALTLAPGTCPVTGHALVLEQCPRAADLRLHIMRWVRQNQAAQ